MRELRDDSDRLRHLDEEEQPRRRRPADSSGKLSQLDASAHAGARLGDLGERQREAVADEALAGKTGALPYQGEMEERFGRSFANVNVAGGVDTRETLAGVGATGVSRDNTIAFREEKPSKEVVAHELAHVVQAERGVSSHQDAEAEAHGAEHAIKMGAMVQMRGGSGGAKGAHFRGEHNPNEHESPYKDPFRTPDDEKKANWGDYVKVQAPGDPMVPFELDPGMACPFPPNAIMEKMPSHHQQNDDYPNPFKDQDKDKVQIGHWKLVQRQEAWDAYRNKALGVKAMQDAVKPDVDLFRHAEKNEELKALGFIMKKGFTGDLTTLAGEQQVPQQGGPSVGSLFGSSGLNLTKADQKSIDGAAHARETGKDKGMSQAFLGTNKADTDLKAALEFLKAAAEQVTATKQTLESAIQAIEYANAEKEAEDAKAEIEELKKTVEFVKGFIEFATSGPGKLAKLAEEGIDKLEAVGTISSLILDIIPIAGMKEAEGKLAAAQEKMKTAKGKQLQANLEAAKASSRGAVHDLAGKRDSLLSALTARRLAYNTAGDASGHAATGNDASKKKVAGLVAAIPIVENVVAALRNISSKTAFARPEWDEKSGLGYGIALYHQNWEAIDLPTAIGMLEWCNLYFGFTGEDWQDRLTMLLKTKEQLQGTTPGGE
jgi:hypothetical protein